MATIPEKLATAVKCHQSGNLHAAERLYCEILQSQPFHADALHLLGILAHQVGRNEVAVDYIGRALQLRPDFAEAHFNLGVVLKAQGKLDHAVASLRQAVWFRPDYADAQNNLGIALKEQGKVDEARACYERALQLEPNLPETHNNLGNLLLLQERFEEAAQSYHKAIRLRPNFIEAQSNLGNALQKLGKPEEAIDIYTQLIRAKPELADARRNLAATLVDIGRLQEALVVFDEAIRLNAADADIRSNKSIVDLLLGNFEQGWRDYEWRLRRSDISKRAFRQPRWDGSPLAGRTILLWAEQGLGDTLHFIRYAALVKELGGRVLVECQKPLLRILEGCDGVDQLLAAGEPLPDFDVHAALLSLPATFNANLGNIPAKVPYLRADPRLVEHWRQELSPISGFKVGIVWQGNPKHLTDRRRSMPLAHFASLAWVPGVRLISLQKGHGTEQIRDVADRFAVVDLGSRLDEGNGAFMDTAAVMKNLDLVISTDTATAHLAGALNVPVWVTLPDVPDWRWLMERSDSPWYPSMRLFRQPRRGDWATVFQCMTKALTELASRPTGSVVSGLPKTPSMRVVVSPGELLDKITILEIKSARITAADKLQNIRTELALLTTARDRCVSSSPELETLTAELRAVNERLWDNEDAIRRCEREADFGPRYVDLARLIYRGKDERATLKRRIDELLGSASFSE